MKLKTILGSIIGLASILLFFTSCTKNMEDLKPEGDVAMLSDGSGCSDVGGLVLYMVTNKQGANPFFWKGNANLHPSKVPAYRKQLFSGTDFSNQQFFVVTGEPGILTHFPASGAVGIGDEYINRNESVSLKLSPCLIDKGFLLRTFHITLNGGNTSKATICLLKDGKLVDEVFVLGHDNPKTPGKGSSNFAVEYHAKFDAFLFDQIVIKTTIGRMLWKAYQPNFNQVLFYPPTHFDLEPPKP